MIKMVPKVKLQVANPEFLSRRIFSLIKNIDIENANKYVFNISISLAKNIQKAKEYKEVKETIISFILNKQEPELIQKTKTLQDVWNKQNERYFLHLKNVLETDFELDTFYGYTTNIMVGNYGDKKDFIVRITDDLKISVYIIMEEVLHLVYWSIWDELFDKKIRNSKLYMKDNEKGISIWKISEIIPEYVFKLDPSSRSKSYPWIPELRKILDPLWQKKKSFKDFIIKAHKLYDLTKGSQS